MDLEKFWPDLEQSLAPGGVRCELAERFGAEAFERLRSAGLLASRGVAEHWPCPRPGGENCPRVLVTHDDGSHEAVCGNVPAECASVPHLGDREVEWFVLDEHALGKAVARAFEVGARCDPVAGLALTWRVGSFALVPGAGYPVYLLVQPSPERYLATLHTLSMRNEKRGLVALVPTERQLTDELEREMRAVGVVLVPLARHVRLGADGAFRVATRPETLLRGVGRPHTGATVAAAEVVAHGIFHDGPRDLTQSDYDAVVAAAESFDTLVDQRGRRVWKRARGKVRATARVNKTYFAVLREVVASRRPFDAVTDSVVLQDHGDAVQTFQRMRQALDLKKGPRRTDDWCLIKSVRTADGRVAYRFSPDPDVKFALIFDVAR